METRITAAVSLKKSERQKIIKLIEDYGFSVSAIVFHMAYYTSRALLTGTRGLSSGKTPRHRICRYALDLYRPFSVPIMGSEPFTMGCTCPFTYDGLKDKLKQVGIWEPGLFFAAIVRAIIALPHDASVLRIRGVYTKRKSSITVVKRLPNKTFRGNSTLPVEVRVQLKEIAQKTNSSVNGLFREVLQGICDIEFSNSTFTENHKVFKKLILNPTRIVKNYKYCPQGYLCIVLSDIKLSVQVKAVIEKYGIPSVSDLLLRIAYFILAVHNGEVKLNTVQIEDNDDYNETRMVRDAYRKELMYGAH